MSWQSLVDENPKLAEFGTDRFSSRVAYLATVRKDGSPRVHPVTPILGGGQLYLFMDPTSPKGHDLRRNGLFALHASVENEDGGQGEFFITGKASLVEDTTVREVAVKHAGYNVAERYILFRLALEIALGTVYESDEKIQHRWRQTG
jgi:uncharacterized pyridoxamine 5'-phosphate oxidase family protein